MWLQCCEKHCNSAACSPAGEGWSVVAGSEPARTLWLPVGKMAAHVSWPGQTTSWPGLHTGGPPDQPRAWVQANTRWA